MTARVCAGVNGRFSLPTSSTSPLAEKMRRETDESQSSLASWVADRGEPSPKTAGSPPRKASTSVRAGIDPKIVPNSPCSRTDDSRHTPKRPCPRPASRHASPKQPTPSRRSSWSEPPRLQPVLVFDSRAHSFGDEPPRSSPTPSSPATLRPCTPSAPGRCAPLSKPRRVSKGTCAKICGRILVPLPRPPSSSFAPASSTSALTRRCSKLLASSTGLRPVNADKVAPSTPPSDRRIQIKRTTAGYPGIRLYIGVDTHRPRPLLLFIPSSAIL